MKIISEISLRDFKFWSGGEDRATNCTDEQLDKIESIMESAAPESGWTGFRPFHKQPTKRRLLSIMNISFSFCLSP